MPKLDLNLRSGSREDYSVVVDALIERLDVNRSLDDPAKQSEQAAASLGEGRPEEARSLLVRAQEVFRKRGDSVGVMETRLLLSRLESPGESRTIRQRIIRELVKHGRFEELPKFYRLTGDEQSAAAMESLGSGLASSPAWFYDSNYGLFADRSGSLRLLRPTGLVVKILRSLFEGSELSLKSVFESTWGLKYSRERHATLIGVNLHRIGKISPWLSISRVENHVKLKHAGYFR